MNAISCSTVAPPSEGHGHAAERAPGEHQQDQVEADDLARGEQARRDQPEHPRIHARECPSMGPVGLVLVRLYCADSGRRRSRVAVVASPGARLPRRPVRGLGHRLAQRPRVLRRRPRRPARRHRAPGHGLPGTGGGRAAGLGADRPARPRASAGSGWCCRCPATSADCPPLPAWPAGPGFGAGGRRRAAGARARGARARGRRRGRRSRWTAPRRSPRRSRARCARCPGRSTSPSATPPARSPGSTSRAGTRRCPHCWPGWRGRRRRPACPTTTTRSRCRCSAARSGWPPSSTWRWPTPRGPRSPTPRPTGRDDSALRPLADAVREAVAAAFNWVPR